MEFHFKVYLFLFYWALKDWIYSARTATVAHFALMVIMTETSLD